MTLLTIALVLFLIMDPIGNVSTFQKMVKGINPKRQSIIVIREMVIALGFMLLFNWIGEHIFSLLQISETTVKISSGLILFLVSLQILFPKQTGIRESVREEEPFVIPLATPLIAGPSVLATIMLYARMEPSLLVMLQAILIAWFCAVLVLLSSRFLVQTLGINGLMACEKLMGMVLVLMAIQRFFDGVSQFLHTLQP